MAGSSEGKRFYKLLCGLLTKRLNSYLESVHAILAEQHRFWRERSIETARGVLITDLERED